MIELPFARLASLARTCSRARRWVALVLLVGTSWVSAQTLLVPTKVHSDQVTAELLVHAPQGIAPGNPVWLGLQLTHAPDWHTYWQNPGDSGLPTQLEWQLPTGVLAGDIGWPTPKKFPLGPLANYGYDGTVLLSVPLTITPEFNAPKLDVGLNASWLACRKECIPEDAQLQINVPRQQPVTVNGVAFEEALANIPKYIANNSLKLSVKGEFIDILWSQPPTKWQGKRLEFFPITPGLTEPGAPWTQEWTAQGWSARVPLSPLRSESVQQLPLVLALADVPHGEAAEAGVATASSVEGTWPPVQGLGNAGVSPALEAALQENAARAPASPASSGGADIGLMGALLGALLGGMVLNLMPCVFPVLAIKVLAFAQHAEDTRAHRLGGLAYTVGVVVSFLALGGLLLGLRAAGEQLGWGFQLQSPATVAGLATLFTVIALNLAGLFEFGSVLPSSVASLQAKHPVVDSFLTGVLATAIASPCTAPFMGASLGLAVALPTGQALAVFGSLGMGMALPYLLASWVPAVARALPRPGAWMNTLRQFMAFPMWATVVWLLWVLGQQTGIDGVAALLMCLVVLALLIWALGLHGRARPMLAGLAALGLAWLLWGVGPQMVRLSDDALSSASASPAQGLTWQTWSAERQAELLAQGRTVFVDFTAAWCVTCQYNKRTTLANTDVMADMAKHQVVLLRADWTRRDPTVTQALALLQRSGVPTYALHRAGQPTQVLSEVLSVQEVRDALAKR